MRSGRAGAELLVGFCWRCANDSESVHPTGSAFCVCARGPAISPLQPAVPRWQIVLHAVNHSTLHRGQIVTMLRTLGLQPPTPT